jgi:glycosyltransferase involved in cell wall biosynthesis
MLALGEVVERRPDVRVVVFGDVNAPQATFEYEFAGVVDPLSLARLYNEAAVGLVISLTNYSRMPKEMMACGLPVVDVRHPSVVSAFDSGVIELAEPDIGSIADALTGLLDDGERRHRLGESGREFVSGMTWAAAAGQLEQHLRRWLRERWPEAAEADSGLASLRARLT